MPAKSISARAQKNTRSRKSSAAQPRTSARDESYPIRSGKLVARKAKAASETGFSKARAALLKLSARGRKLGSAATSTKSAKSAAPKAGILSGMGARALGRTSARSSNASAKPSAAVRWTRTPKTGRIQSVASVRNTSRRVPSGRRSVS